MDIGNAIIVLIGLALFESITSIDNAVVNADVLITMAPKWRRWFLLYGIFFAVFVVRGILPLLIVKFSTPGLSFSEAFTATLGNNDVAKTAIEHQAPMMLAGGGIFLLFLFFHWLFLEDKKYAFFLERHIHHRLNLWFYAVASIILLAITTTTIHAKPSIALGSIVGSTAFFIISGFRRNAEEMEKNLTSSHLSNLSKLLYLELLDMTFSLDGVLGAFAFTISVPLILIGNGLGAFLVRYVTVRGVAVVKKYGYLKNGAMYSIGLLGLIMELESFGHVIAAWLPPLITVVIVGFFFMLSRRELKETQLLAQ